MEVDKNVSEKQATSYYQMTLKKTIQALVEEREKKIAATVLCDLATDTAITVNVDPTVDVAITDVTTANYGTVDLSGAGTVSESGVGDLADIVEAADAFSDAEGAVATASARANAKQAGDAYSEKGTDEHRMEETVADDYTKATKEAEAVQDQMYGVLTTKQTQFFEDDVDTSTDTMAKISPMGPSKFFSEMMKKIPFTIFTPLSDLGCFSWKSHGEYIPIHQIRSEATIQRYINLSGQPAWLSRVDQISLNIRFGTVSNKSNRFFNKFPYGDNEIASLHVATQVSSFESTLICYL